MSEVKQVAGTGVPLFLDDIDTDRIIPARFLRCVTFDGLGEHAFEDDRKQDPNHRFDDERFKNGNVLVSGRNFGCGSSREHAPQSLMRWGIKAIVAESFAEIFFGNCTGLGIPAVCADRDDLKKVAAAIEASPDLAVSVDLETLKVNFGDDAIDCTTTEEARSALTSGQWDFLSQLLAEEPAIRDTSSNLPYLNNFA